MTEDDGTGRSGTPGQDGVRRVVFHEDYALSILLEADGTLRKVLHVSGVEGADFEEMRQRNVVENARLAVDGEARAAEWIERLDRLRTTMEPLKYRTVPPGAAPGQPETVYCTATPIPAADGTLDAILLQTEDRTTALRVEAELRDSEMQFRALAESLPQMVWVADAQGSVSYFSPQWATFTGRSVETLLGHGFRDLVHPDDRELVRAKQFAPGEYQDVEFRLLRHDGEYRLMEAHYRVILDGSGRPARRIGGTTDITDRRQEETTRLRWQKREAIGTLAGGVAHDFNNVISAILSNAALAERELGLGLSPSTSVAEISRGAERAAAIVQRLLAFSREENDEELHQAPFDLGAVTQEACTLVLSVLPPEATLRCSAHDDLPPVFGSAEELHRVVVNLLTNAGHAVEERGSSIHVSVEAAPAAPDGPAGGRVRLTVDDDGPGIPPAVLDRIFDPFFTTKPTGKGTGLGLAASQTIVRHHGGTIEAASRPGGGARFVVELPAMTPAPSGTDERNILASPPRSAAGEARIVFVDDEAPLVMLAERALPAFGHAVRAFQDPVAALAAIEADPTSIDALLTDLAMPSMSGLNLVAAVRALRPGLPVVLSSGFLTTANLRAAEQLGVDAIVPKPCSIDDLAGALERVLSADRR